MKPAEARDEPVGVDHETASRSPRKRRPYAPPAVMEVATIRPVTLGTKAGVVARRGC
jgi:hypothetical protein